MKDIVREICEIRDEILTLPSVTVYRGLSYKHREGAFGERYIKLFHLSESVENAFKAPVIFAVFGLSAQTTAFLYQILPCILAFGKIVCAAGFKYFCFVRCDQGVYLVRTS